jgi:hypothetical protein
MSTPHTAPTSAPEVGAGTGSPNQYHLQDQGVRTSLPGGAGPLTVDGPIIVPYQDAKESLVFRGKQAQVVSVVDSASDNLVTQASLASPR